MAFASRAQERKLRRMAKKGEVGPEVVERHAKESKGLALPERSATPAAVKARHRKARERIAAMFSRYAARFEYDRKD